MLAGLLRKIRAIRHPRPQSGPKLECQKVVLGTEYGGYAVCPTPLDANSVVYSFGVGCDVSFDLGLIELRGVTVHAFDPTPRSIEWVSSQALPERFKFHGWGIADFDGSATFHPPKDPTHVSHTVLAGKAAPGGSFEVPVFRLKTIMDRLGHDHLDVLKMDVEGAEYAALNDILTSGIPISQLLIEFHHHRPEVSLAQTQAALDALVAAGFRVFHENPSGHEFSLAHAARLSAAGAAAQ